MIIKLYHNRSDFCCYTERVLPYFEEKYPDDPLSEIARLVDEAINAE
jgi:hypothetical protein